MYKKNYSNVLEEQKDVEPETLEQIVQRVAEAYKKTQRYKQNGSEAETANSLDEAREAELVKIVTNASHSLKPERDEDFLEAIPELHCSWPAIKQVNSHANLQRVYAMIMLAIYEQKIPIEAETRILCLDNAENFVQVLDECGQEWSRRGQTLIRTQHPKLYRKMFNKDAPVYYTFID